jgi:hypothetical protein
LPGTPPASRGFSFLPWTTKLDVYPKATQDRQSVASATPDVHIELMEIAQA